MYFNEWPNRTACDVLEELRKCNQTRNYAPVLALTEELQSIFNRMEASLGDKRDVKEWQQKRRELKAEIKQLSKKLEKKKLKVSK